MEEQKDLPQEEKNAFQLQKESWYDKLNVTLKQMDMIVTLCWVALGITVVLIALDAMDIFHLFG